MANPFLTSSAFGQPFDPRLMAFMGGPPANAPRLPAGQPQMLGPLANAPRLAASQPQLPSSLLSGAPMGPPQQFTPPALPQSGPPANAPRLGQGPARPPSNPLANAPMLPDPQAQPEKPQGFMGRIGSFLGSPEAMELGIGLLSGDDWGSGLARGFAGIRDMRKEKDPFTTDDLKEYGYAKSQGFTGTFPQWQLMMKRAGGTNVNVNAGQYVESEYDKTLGKGLGEEFLGIQGDSRKAIDALTSLSAMEQAMNDPNFYSGMGSDAVMALKRGIATFGGNPEEGASMEAFNALSKKAALDNMGGSLGTGFSNADRDFVVEQVPSLANTPEGNRRLVEINKAIQSRKLQIGQFANQYAASHGGRIDQGFYDSLAQWAAANPLFPSEPPKSGSGSGNRTSNGVEWSFE